MIHRASGARGESREHREQIRNKHTAFKRMAESAKFRGWHKLECARRMGQPTVEELVEAAMKPWNIKVEVKDDENKWTPEGI